MTENNPAAEGTPQPLLWHGGQAWTPQTADAKRNELMQNKDFVRAALDGDTGKAKELAYLYMLARGHVPAPPQDAPDVLQQMETRTHVTITQHMRSLSEDGFTPAQAWEIAHGRPAPPEEIQMHKDRLVALKKDAGFIRRYLDGDVEARNIMRHHHAGSVMRPGTLAEIEAWTAQNPMPARSA